MKFRHYLESITDVGIYPMVSLFIFFVFFSLLAVWAFKANKSYINTIKNIPLGNDNDNK
ncbi:MAG: CcoQ/FixQ family Cbb3-type cytochrome c oxidase assembly chaperone [Flavipsychrobacter sp.]|nr:CcoQ/FixQ family Cbb3-type cytochrome c oxidase assembly chaperone [Flavipsychrobacter sp.]